MYPGIHRVLRICVAAIGLLAGLPLAAQNLLQNPGFATSLDPWASFNAFGVTAVWSSFDASNDPTSGSVYATIPANNGFNTPPTVYQCVAIEPKSTYLFGGKAYLPSATVLDDASASIRAQVYTTTDCTSSPDQLLDAPDVTARDIWSIVSAPVTSGAAELSIRIALVVYTPTSDAMQLYFDDIFLMQDTIFHDGFE
jgi:hypothetical protein